MEIPEYEVMYQSEEGHWWYVGLRDLVLPAVLEGVAGIDRPTILDAGCGTGATLAFLRGDRAFGLEYSAEAFIFLRRRGLARLARGSVDRIPFADGSFDAILSADVLCCLGSPGDLDALREFRRVLKPGGRLVMNLPAYQWLRSGHDQAVHTRRRYTRGELGRLLTQADLRIRTNSYRNSILFPIVVLVRLAQRLVTRSSSRIPHSDLRPLPAVLNWTLSLPLLLENRLIRLGFRFPFGLSAYVVAERPRSEENAG
ncbi:MAG: class I SAM-dependent methyltransferase [Isosphaeraceae bacterium]